MVELKKITQLAWRRHLLSDPGVEGMLFLRERSPVIHKASADEMIFEAGMAEGYKLAIDTISEIIAAEPKKEENLENV
jgi:hypothetical protein